MPSSPLNLGLPNLSYASHIRQVTVKAIAASQPISHPVFRCRIKPNVCSPQAHLAVARLVKQYRQIQRTRLALLDALPQEILRHARVKDGIHEQDVASFQRGRRREENLGPFKTSQVHLSQLRPHKMANDRLRNLANQISREQKRILEDRHHVQSAIAVVLGDRPAHLGHPRRQLFAGICDLHVRLSGPSTTIHTPVRVALVVENSSATGIRSAQATRPALVSTGHRALSVKPTRPRTNIRASLRVCRRPEGRYASPGLQFRNTNGAASRSASRTTPSCLVSRCAAGQSIIFKRKERPSSGMEIAVEPLTGSVT